MTPTRIIKKMKDITKKYIQSLTPLLSVGSLHIDVMPTHIKILYWRRKSSKSVELKVLEFLPNGIMGVAEKRWEKKALVIKKEDFMKWCSENLSADETIEAYNKWKELIKNNENEGN